MNVDKTQNANFSGTVHLVGQAKANDPILRPLIHHLKYNCGNKNTHHYIDVCDIDDSIQSVYSIYNFHKPSEKKGGYLIHIGGGKDKTIEYITHLINKSKETNAWINNVRLKNKEAEQQKQLISNQPEKQSFLGNLFSLLKK